MKELNSKKLKVLRLICEDYSNIEIASKLDYKLRSLEKIKSALYKATRTHSNVGLLKWAVVNGLYTIKKKPQHSKPKVGKKSNSK